MVSIQLAGYSHFPSHAYSLSSMQVPSWKVQRAAINGALALEVLLKLGREMETVFGWQSCVIWTVAFQAQCTSSITKPTPVAKRVIT